MVQLRSCLETLNPKTEALQIRPLPDHQTVKSLEQLCAQISDPKRPSNPKPETTCFTQALPSGVSGDIVPRALKGFSGQGSKVDSVFGEVVFNIREALDFRNSRHSTRQALNPKPHKP